MYSSVWAFSVSITPTASAQSAVERPQHGVRADQHVVQLDLGGTLPVDRAVVSRADALHPSLDDEEADALRIARTARGPCRNDEPVRLSAPRNHRLVTLKYELVALPPRARGHFGELVARVGLRVSERQQQLPPCRRRQQAFLLRGRSSARDQPCPEDHTREVGLDHESAAEHL
jgi:hypothetical protein